ncbi:DUF6290 family protein [Carnobacterium maltaromaticum]|uniref:DUF6290 family protein n=1 Tax=Carnobacterium maltaromaticum TaxID=2751 RepID=UPI0012F85A79|nr:DUF6290 family protein [Carnobacterium maltaromaticum]
MACFYLTATEAQIEDSIDLKTYENTMKSHKQNNQAISFDEMMRELEEQSKPLDTQ